MGFQPKLIMFPTGCQWNHGVTIGFFKAIAGLQGHCLRLRQEDRLEAVPFCNPTWLAGQCPIQIDFAGFSASMS